jgi:hypothetical protein
MIHPTLFFVYARRGHICTKGYDKIENRLDIWLV